jgi:cytohesin
MSLHESARTGDLAGVDAALAAGADVNSVEDGYTPLMQAADEGHVAIVRRLLAAGAAPDARDELGQTALRKAVSAGGHLEACRRLLDMPESNGQSQFEVIRALRAAGADVNAADAGGQTPLLAAAAGGYWELIDVLLPLGADVNAADRRGETPLLAACESGHTGRIRQLLAAGADPNVMNRSGETPLLTVLTRASDESRPRTLERVRLLLAAGADPNGGFRTRKGTLCDDAHPRGTTPLMLAAGKGWLEVVEVLLAGGADVAARNRKGQTALVLAARSGHAAVVQRLKAAGATEAVDEDRYRAAALMRAADAGDVAAIRKLLAAGVHPDVPDPNDRGWTALLHAVRDGRYEAVELLLGAGADPNLCLTYPPVVAAAEHGRTEILRALIGAGSRLDSRDHRGDTALVAAARNGYAEVLQLLLDARAHQGDGAAQAAEALARAAEGGHAAAVEALLGAGVRPTPRALVAGAGHGSAGVIDLLLAAGSDPNAPDPESGDRPLPALLRGYRTVTKDADQEALRRLLQGGADPNAQDCSGTTPLHIATWHDDGAALIGLMLAAGASVDGPDARGVTPLMTAAGGISAGTPETVAALLAAGAAVNARDRAGRTPLHHAAAASEDAAAVVPALVAAGADVNAADADGRTPLMTAAVNCHDCPETLRELLAAGADLHARDRGGLTALGLALSHPNPHPDAEAAGVLRAAGATDDAARENELRRAAAAGDPARVRELIRDGADVNSTVWGREYGAPPPGDWEAHARNPLTEAVGAGHADVVRELLSAGAAVNLRSVSDYLPRRTLLMEAALAGRAEVVELLVAAGERVDPTDANGHTALLFAARNGPPPVAQALLAAGAPVGPLEAPFLAVLDFAEAARARAFEGAVAAVARLCEAEPVRLEDRLAGVVCFRIEAKRESRALQKADPELHRLTADVVAHMRKLDELRDRAAEAVRGVGYSAVKVRFGRFAEEVLALFPTADPLAVVAAVSPYKKDDSFYCFDVVAALNRLAVRQPFAVVGCAATSVELELPDLRDRAALEAAGFSLASTRPGRLRATLWWDD